MSFELDSLLQQIITMNPRVTDVKPEKDYTLHVWFKNGEKDYSM